MKYALFSNVRIEPTKGAKGFCPLCGAELIAKCGEIKIHHWAHKGTLNCDPWCEKETEWHRYWKNKFPLKWQEVIHSDKNCEKHIADVKTDENWVLEFQHSPIRDDERRSRNKFYSKIVWIVDGIRLERDKLQFQKMLDESTQIKWGKITIFRIGILNLSRLLKEWFDSNVPVLFDFQDTKDFKKSKLWFLVPNPSRNFAYLLAFSGSNFIELHNNKGFDELALKLVPALRNYLSKLELSNTRFVFNYPRPNRGRL